mgnify:CR=1 FL=1
MPSAWQTHLAAYRATHPRSDLKTCMQEASKTYQRSTSASYRSSTRVSSTRKQDRRRNTRQDNNADVLEKILGTPKIQAMLKAGPRVNGEKEVYTQDMLLKNAIEEMIKDLVYRQLFSEELHLKANHHKDVFNETDDVNEKKQVFREILESVNKRIVIDVDPLQIIYDNLKGS